MQARKLNDPVGFHAISLNNLGSRWQVRDTINLRYISSASNNCHVEFFFQSIRINRSVFTNLCTSDLNASDSLKEKYI